MKSIIYIIIIIMFPFPALAETFKDSFNDRNLKGWKQYPEKGIWENRNGAVDIRIPASDNPQNILDQVYFLTLVSKDYGEYTLSCKVMVHILEDIDPDKAENFIGGLAFRYVDDVGGIRSYFAGISPRGLNHGSCNTNPEAKSAFENSGIVYSRIELSFEEDKWYELTTKVHKNSYSVILDSKSYNWDNCVFDDNRVAGFISSGGVGLFAATYPPISGEVMKAQSVEFLFDDFILTGEGIPGNDTFVGNSKLLIVWGLVKLRCS